VSDAALSDEREHLLQRFFALAPREQLAAYRAIRDYLATRIHETKRDRLVETRAAALDALASVASHLKLEPGVAPTPREFDAGARDLGLDWNRSRVARAWGRWRFAKEAFAGGRLRDSADQRARRRATAGRARTQEAALVAVRLWLATHPPKETVRDYEAWAEEHNDKLAPGDLPLPNATTIRKRIPITWRDIIRVGRDEITVKQGRPPREHVRRRHAHGEHHLISVLGVSEILAHGDGYDIRKEISKPSFPRPVVALNRVRLWLRDDVVAYKKGRPFPERKQNELRYLYLTTPEVLQATGLSRSGLGNGAHGVPSPAIQAGSINLWLRSEVDAWLKRRPG
jgi:predicted DNA-binding transcriptional regulator AlpA